MLMMNSMADSVASENIADDAEAKVWSVFERVFCFLKGMTIYQCRRRLKFIIVSQSVINSLRIIPIVLGLSYQATMPVAILVRAVTRCCLWCSGVSLGFFCSTSRLFSDGMAPSSSCPSSCCSTRLACS